jgi:hypothetical protein
MVKRRADDYDDIVHFLQNMQRNTMGGAKPPIASLPQFLHDLLYNQPDEYGCVEGPKGSHSYPKSCCGKVDTCVFYAAPDKEFKFSDVPLHKCATLHPGIAAPLDTVAHHPLLCEVNPSVKLGQRGTTKIQGTGHLCIRPSHLMITDAPTNKAHEALNVIAWDEIYSTDDAKAYAKRIGLWNGD